MLLHHHQSEEVHPRCSPPIFLSPSSGLDPKGVGDSEDGQGGEVLCKKPMLCFALLCFALLCFALLCLIISMPSPSQPCCYHWAKYTTRVHPIRIRGSSQQLPCAGFKPVSIRPLIGATAKLLSPSSAFAPITCVILHTRGSTRARRSKR